MLNKNRKARLLGAMALVASATAELQRLQPRSLHAADAAAKATTRKGSPDLRETRKPPSPRELTTGLKSRGEKSKLNPRRIKPH